MNRGKLSGVKDAFGSSLIELYSNNRAVVFDCRCVIDYSDEEIVLDLGSVRLKITGKKLTVDSFVFGQTDIKGQICRLEFC